MIPKRIIKIDYKPSGNDHDIIAVMLEGGAIETTADVIMSIETFKQEYFVLCNSARIKVRVNTFSNGGKCLITEADKSESNNLLSLPRFDSDKRTALEKISAGLNPHIKTVAAKKLMSGS